MKYKILIINLFCLTKICFAQQILTDNSYHFSFMLPPEWLYQHNDSAKSFIRFECFNPDSSAMIELYAIKTESSIDLNKFSYFATSEKILGKSLGRFQDSTKFSINKIDAIKKNYLVRTRRGAQIDIQAFMLVKGSYGYVIVSRCLKNVKQSEALMQIIESFTVKLPRSAFSWLFLIGLIGVCLYGLGLGSIRTFKWLQPLDFRAIAYCAIFSLICLVSLVLIYIVFQKINVLISLVSGGFLLFGISKLPNATPVIEEYNKVKMKNTAGTYRAFCQKNQSSRRYYNDARKQMNALLDEVIRKYQSLVSKLDTPVARAALAMFEYIKKTDNFQVGVHYVGDNQIKDFADFVKLERNWNVLPANPAFTESKNRKREESITGLINYAFHQVTPEDILSFSTVNKLKSDQINFEITYTINASGNLYCQIKEKDLPDDKKKWYTGVEFKWLLEIRIPLQRETYKLSLESKPAQEFSTQGDATDIIYDAMADSAFRDFSRVFIEQSGLMAAVKQDIERREKTAAVDKQE